ncbi:IS4 family transposase [Streptomyces sp. NPDC056437]|uniref:IS4 family transposase n=1 Tax=Streptomyces sp. NPDC056437 TaxID=3345816 RepID=UPI0036BB1544
MARPGQVKSSGERLSDRIALGVLTRVFPPELVDEVIVECRRVEQRSRLLPARVVVYFVLAMCLFSGQGYEEVARLLTQGLERVRRRDEGWRVPTTGAIGRARRRLGPEPLKVLFDRVCRPVASAETAGAWYRDWRLVAVDGTVFDVPDTEANAGFFGRPGTGRGQQRTYPQVRVAALVECGTHAVFAAQAGPLSVHERQLIPGLLGRLEPGMLLVADRGITGFELWKAASGTGADLLWRVRKNIILPVLQAFEDGSYLSEIVASRDWGNRDPARVRVIEYSLGRSGDETVYRLITTICDSQQAPATDLAALYHQGWEIENTLDEMKTHQGGRPLVLRSQYPDGVEQEIYGFLLVHHALRDIMHHTARPPRLDPDRTSFTRTLRIARRHVTGQGALSSLPAQPGPHTHHL